MGRKTKVPLGEMSGLSMKEDTKEVQSSSRLRTSWYPSETGRDPVTLPPKYRSGRTFGLTTPDPLPVVEVVDPTGHESPQILWVYVHDCFSYREIHTESSPSKPTIGIRVRRVAPRIG